jgi:hypothetical protein
MKRVFYGSLVMILLAGGTQAQDDMGGYSFMEIVQIGELIGGFSGGFEQMTGGVEIVLRSDDPALEALPIKARTMRFEYQGDSLDPARILMDGGVNVAHPTANVQSDGAVWNFESGEMTFTGNVVMNNDRMKNVRASQLVLDLNQSRFTMSNVKADQVNLPSEDNKRVTGMLTASDINSMDVLAATIKAELAAEGAAPGKRIHALLPNEAQSQFNAATPEQIASMQDAFIKQFNGVLRSPTLYDEASWSGKTLDDEAKTLLAQPERGEAETVRLNRWLLHAAYPNHIASP